MKKNRTSQFGVPFQKYSRKREAGSGEVPAFLFIGLCLLLASFLPHLSFSGLPRPGPGNPESPGQYLWISGSPEFGEGLYFLTSHQLQETLPELLSVVSDKPAGLRRSARVGAVRYRSGRPVSTDIPPEISSLFFLPVPINRAGKEVLSSLPGVGPVLAGKIIQRRNSIGPFGSKDDLLEIAGIGPKKFARLADHIIID